LVLEALVTWWVCCGRLSTSSAPSVDDALQVEFIVRIAPREKPAARATGRRRADVTSARTGDRSHASSEGGALPSAPTSVIPSGPSPPPPVFDLHVPERLPTLAPRDPLRRHASMDAASTRFDAHWAPAGNVLEQAAFRSPAAGIAIHAFGGPPRRCTEIERRRRRPDCLPLTGQGDEDERLRRSLDP
jgi:hypothetical protein